MPIYEYRCADCGHELEAMQKMSEDPLTDCPACSKPTLKKKISAVGFRLKGGGWYETDFKTGDKKKNLANKDESPSSSKDNKDSGKSESAKKTESAAKSDTKPAKAATSATT
ncbi:MAG: zinc ribbon domain-containing protein [Candidatus Competibacteraceae bacterium]|nr:zinc ribbon domain-containing protein [Candidatus Competibacteraceae bacterium]